MVLEYLAIKEGIKQILTLKDWKRPRSTGKPDELGNQLGAWFKFIVEPYRKFRGIRDKLEAHYEILHEISYEIVRDGKGRERRNILHTQEMNTTQMAELWDNGVIWMAEENGIEVQDPDPSKSKRRKRR